MNILLNISNLSLEYSSNNGKLYILDNVNFNINYTRYLIEIVILSVIKLCHINIFKIIIPKINQKFLGLLFFYLRIFWKRLTKKTKRKELRSNAYSK